MHIYFPSIKEGFGIFCFVYKNDIFGTKKVCGAPRKRNNFFTFIKCFSLSHSHEFEFGIFGFCIPNRRNTVDAPNISNMLAFLFIIESFSFSTLSLTF